MEEKIVEKAHEMYLKYGIKSVTMGDLSRELGVSKKTLYQFVENKEDLVAKTMQYQVKKEIEKVKTITANSENAVEELFRISRHNAAILRRMSPTTMYDLKKYYNPLWEERRKRQWVMIKESIGKNLRWGMDEGLFRSDIDINIAIVHVTKIMETTIDDRLVDKEGYSRLEIFEETFNYHIHGIASPKGLEIWNKYKEEYAEKA